MRLILFLLLLPFHFFGQLNPAFIEKSGLLYNKVEYKGDGLFGFEINDKFGYIDKSGKVIIPAEYSYKLNDNSIPFFYNGLIAIKKDNKMAIIDKTGKIIIPFDYDNLYVPYNLKMFFPAVRKENGKNLFGVINSQNKVVIPITNDEMLMDSNLVKVKKDGKWGLMDITGKQILPFEYDAITTYSREKLVQTTKGDQLIFMDPQLKPLFEKIKSVYTIKGCSDGMICCKVNDKYGYLDLKGNEVIITRYDDAYDFVNGLAKVGKKTPASGGAILYGFIDKKGNEIVPLIYPSANLGLFQFGLIKAKDPETNRFGYYDKTGKWVLQPVYLEATNSDYLGGLWVKMTDGKFHYITKTGKDFGTINNKGDKFYFFGDAAYTTYEDVERPYVLMDKTGKVIKTIEDCDGIFSFSDGLAGYKCKSNGKYGFLDVKGNKIISCEYDGFNAFTEGVSKVSKTIDGKTKNGYIDNKGNVIVPVVYENAQNFKDGWGIIKKDSNYFFVDKSGNLKEPPRKYTELTEFRSGYAFGKAAGTGNNKNTYYYINTQLKEEFSVAASLAYQFWEDVAVVSRDGKTYELMNKKGEIFKILTGIETLKFTTDGLLAIKEKGKWGYINQKGEYIVNPKYDDCESYKYGYAKVKMGTKWGIIDKSGTEIIQPKYDNIAPGENGFFIFYTTAWGAMDKTGKIIIEPSLNPLTAFEKDVALGKLGKTFTIIKSPLAK